MKVTPKTEEELQREQLCPEGVYPFTCLSGAEKESKSVKNPGKMMFAVKVNIHAGEGADYHCFDYFADWFGEYKLRHFAETTGLLKNYESGDLDANLFKDRTGYVQVGIQEAKNGYGPKNTIEDYLTEAEAKEKGLSTVKAAPKMESQPISKPAKQPYVSDDSDIPF